MKTDLLKLQGLFDELKSFSANYQFIDQPDSTKPCFPGGILYCGKDIGITINVHRYKGGRVSFLRFNSNFPGICFRKDIGWTFSMDNCAGKCHSKVMELITKSLLEKSQKVERNENETVVEEMAKETFKERAFHIEAVNKTANVSLVLGRDLLNDPRMGVKVKNVAGELKIQIQETGWLSMDQFNRIIDIMKETKPDIVEELLASARKAA